MILVQIQDRLRAMPMPLLMQYANGSNPEVPPYVALAVLKEKQTEQQQMANMQGAAQGEMPSVKSQLEQKVGTMQQQASMQPMGLQQPAAPAPQGPVQMASGGLASSARFARGGAIGFNGKKRSDVPEDEYETPYDRARREEREAGTGGLEQMLRYARAPLDAAADVARLPVSLIEHMFYNGKGESPSWTPAMDERTRYLEGLKNSPEAVKARAQTEVANLKPVSEVPANGPTLPQGIAGARNYSAQTPGSAQPPISPSAPRPGAPRPAATTAPAPESMAAMLRASLAKSPEAPTVEGAAGIVQGMQKQFGVDKPAGDEERRLIEQMNQRYAESKKGKDLRDFQSVMAAFGRGPGAAGLEDVRLHAADTAADMAHQKGVYDMLNKINTANRTEQVNAAAKGMGIYGDQEKNVADKDRANLQALASAYHTDVSAGAQLQAARMMQAAREAGMDSKEIQMAEAAYARDPEAAAIKKTLENPIIANNPAKMRAAIERLSEIQRSKYEAFGAKMPGATPGAPKTGGKIIDWNSISTPGK